MNIRELLLDQQRRFFVGRGKEIALLQQLETQTHNDWRWIHIYGQGGIGKTMLLRFFTEQLTTVKGFFFDGHSGFQKPLDFIQRLWDALQGPNSDTSLSIEEVTDYMNKYAKQHGGLILILDTFEQWNHIEDWLRDEWLPTLHPAVKVCSAGKYPLGEKWLRSGWDLLTYNHKLKPFSSSEMQQYAHLRGVEDNNQIILLQKFSNGLPLALSMACEIMIREGKTDFLDHIQKQEMIGYLAKELARDVTNPTLQIYLEAAALVWRFDQDLLRDILQEEVPTDLYRLFCQLPFITRNEDAWLLHGSVRQWVYADFKNRQPVLFQTYRQRALHALRKREQENPKLKQELSVDKIYLHEHDFIRNFSFQWEENVTVRECKLEDLKRMEELYCKLLQSQENYINGEDHLRYLIAPLFEIEPTRFIGIWKDEILVAFLSSIPLREESVVIFQKNQITVPVTNKYSESEEQYLLCLLGLEPDLEHKIIGAIARVITNVINKQATYFILTCISEWFPILPLLGFEQAEWGNSTSPKGVVYQAFQLIQSLEDYPTRIDRLLSSFDSKPSSTQRDFPLSLSEIEKYLKGILKNYDRLYQKPEVFMPLKQLVYPEDAAPSSEQLAFALQTRIGEVLQLLASREGDDPLYSQMIKYAYTEKIGAHHIVAERLNLTVPTYYRYLKVAISKIAYEMMNTQSDY